MENLVKDFLSQKRFAVVGSFRNKEKFAYKILIELAGKGYEVFPVNPGMQEVEGKTCYKTIGDIPHSIDVVSLITPPVVSEKIVKECLQKGIKRVWCQPGAESQTVIKFCQDNNISAIHGVCVLLKAVKREIDNG